MRWTISLAVLALVGCVTRAADPGLGEPIVALSVDDFRDRPQLYVAVYPDGRVLRNNLGSGEFQVAQLSPSQLASLLSELPLAQFKEPRARPVSGNDGYMKCVMVSKRGTRVDECFWFEPEMVAELREHSLAVPSDEVFAIWKRLTEFVLPNPSIQHTNRVLVWLEPPRPECERWKWPRNWPNLVARERRHQYARIEVPRDEARELEASRGCPRQVELSGELRSVWLAPADPSIPTR